VYRRKGRRNIGFNSQTRREKMVEKSRKKLKSRGGKDLGAVLMAILLVGAMAYTTTAAAAEPKVIKLKYSTSFFPPEPPCVFANRTLDLVETKTNGRVKVERFVGGALGGPLEQLGLASSGAADLISLHIDQYAQQLPLHQITNTEQLVSGAQGLANVTAILHELKKTKPLFEAEQKKNNIKILHCYCNGPTGVTARFPAESLADVKGKKVNVIAAYQRDVFKELGWIPVNVQIPELYEALSRGVIDAIFMATAANVPLKWHEIGKVHLQIGVNTILSTPLAFNLDSWNRLPADVQKAFMEAAWETAQWTVQATEENLKNTYKAFEGVGAKVVYISDKESVAFFEVLFKHSISNWLKISKAAGVEKDAKVIQKYWDEMKWGKWKKK
jgi:TRAP-type C4-dicarboxylate transport system substrate-binding protein